MILVWGIPGDGPIRSVCDALKREGESPLMLDQFSVTRSHIVFHEECPSNGWLFIEGERRSLEEISAVYPRPYESARVLKADDQLDEASAMHAARFDDAMLLWLELTSALVVNVPSAMTSNGSKPFQSTIIAKAGFDVPELLLTTDPTAAAKFKERYGKVIYKSISGVRSRVSVLHDQALDRLAAAACPIQLQEYIGGTDFRVHVVGNQTFACRIESKATDYRYPGASSEDPEIEACQLPGEVIEKCIALTHLLGLSLSGIDLRLSDDGRWICFEANPSPGFTFYEQATGAPITASLAKLLRRSAA